MYGRNNRRAPRFASRAALLPAGVSERPVIVESRLGFGQHEGNCGGFVTGGERQRGMVRESDAVSAADGGSGERNGGSDFELLKQTRESLAEVQQALSLEQDLFAMLVDNMPDSIYFKDRSSRFVRCNRKTAEILGLTSPAEAIGRTDHDYFCAEEADVYRADEMRIMETGQPSINKEEYERWPDGQYHWVLTTKMPLRDAAGNVIGTFGLSRDITELKQTQQRLADKVSELESLHSRYVRERTMFSTLVDTLPDAVFFKDRDSRFLRVNPAMAEAAGFRDPAELEGLTDSDIWQEELAAAARRDEQQIMETGEPVINRQEKVCRRDDPDDVRWVLATKMPLKDEAGRIAGTFGLARDITMLKFTQECLSESQERFELAIQGSNDGLWDWNLQNDEVWYSPRFRELLGYDAADDASFPNLLSSFMERLHPGDLERVHKAIDLHLESVAGGETTDPGLSVAREPTDLSVSDQQTIPYDIEYRLRTRSGEYRWFRGRGQAVRDEYGQLARMAGSIQDIHDRHEAQRALVETRLQLEQALQGGNVGMWDWDLATNNVVVSPELMLQIGEKPDRPWTNFADWEQRVHPDDLEEARHRVWDYIEGRTDEYESSFRLRHADGGYRWILSRGKLFRDDVGQPGRFIGVHVDLTKLRETEAALERSEAKFRGIFNQTFQFIGLMTPDGTLIDANRTALKAAGIPESRVIGRKFWETPWWAHSEQLQERLKQAVDRAAQGEFDRFEATHPTADGSTMYVDFSIKPTKDESGRIVYLIPEGRDVTELKKSQEQLRARSEELERSNRELEQFAYV
ncbi:MAG: PAS domain S-box protein, partial [Planctomycetaceae bacterium]|nr:PAS domain S-box protein [Planctomycetaceae bacterium]